jgi:hypothetical protein
MLRTAPIILDLLILVYLAKNTNYETPHYVIFCSPLVLSRKQRHSPQILEIVQFCCHFEDIKIIYHSHIMLTIIAITIVVSPALFPLHAHTRVIARLEASGVHY